MKLDRIPRFRYLSALWLLGVIALGFVTWICFRLGFNATTTAFAYLIVIVLLCPMDSMMSSAIFSVIAVGLLNFFFVEPLFSFQVEYAQDLTTLCAFLAASFFITGFVRQVRKLGKAQHEQAQLLDLTHDTIIVRDLNDAVTYWNRGAEELYGWTTQEATGKTTHQLLQTIFPDALDAIKGTLLRDGCWKGELLHTKRDGTQVSVASRWSLRRDENGQCTGTLEINSDITDRKRIANALRRTEAEYLAEAQKLSRTGSFGWSPSRGEIFWSEETFRIFGFEPTNKATPEMAMNHVHPGDLALLRNAIKRAENETEDFDFVYRLRMPEGSIKHVQVVARSVADETGTPMYVGAVMDITARKKTEDALRYSESRYHNLFRAMAASFWELDVSEVREMLRSLRDSGVTDFEAYFDANPGFLREMIRRSRVIDVNDQTVAMFGGSKEELQVNVERIWPEETNPYYADAILQSIMGKPDYSCECKLSRLDGTHFDAQLTAAFPPKSFRMGPLILGIIDITARKKAEKMLEHVQAEFAHAARISVLGELTASIAHEVNQPLAAITANGEAGLRRLGQSEPGIEKARDLMKRMVADARRAAEIISRVRAMAARREPEHARLSLYQVIDEVLMFLGHEIQSCGVTVALDRDPVPEVLVDRTQLQQVFVNLAVNAMQAMVRSGGSRRVLTIRTRRSEEGTASCIVEDSGPGIKPEHLDRLFESFFTTKDGGMGMGLPICRSIIEAHGGCIRVDNDSTHGGARFTFTLPGADVVH